MDKVRRSTLLGLGLLLLYVGACKVSCTTANISSVKLGKDKDISQETHSFAPHDTIYVVATISNNPSKVKVKGRLVVEEVEGEKSGPVPSSEKTFDVPGDGTVTFTLSHPRGLPRGKYKYEVLMLNEGGEQKDQETATFTVSGGGGGITPSAPGDGTAEDNANDSEDSNPPNE